MKRSTVNDYYAFQEQRVKKFSDLCKLPFSYQYTGGGCDAIYGETSTHRIFITNDANVPNANEEHYVGVYNKNDDDLVAECWAKNRAELLAAFSSIKTLDELVSFLIGDGFNGFTNITAL